MKILIAEDDPISARVLEVTLRDLEFEVVVTRDGLAAWQALQATDSPPIAILDWMMPGMDGLEICRRIRATPRAEPPYVILLTARTSKQDIVVGLESGANDYVTKPFDRAELTARLKVGQYTVELQRALVNRVNELEEALARIKRLHGLLPICAWCKKIRNDQDYWEQVEDYIGTFIEVQFTHGICPDCLEKNLNQFANAQAPPSGT